MHRLGRDPAAATHTPDRIRPRNLRGRPGHLPRARRRCPARRSPRRRRPAFAAASHRSPTPAYAARTHSVRVASEAPRGCAASESPRSIGSAGASFRVRADGAREPRRARGRSRVRAAAFVVRIVAALSPPRKEDAAGVQRGVRPQLEQGRAPPRAQHRRRVPQPAVQPQRERPVRARARVQNHRVAKTAPPARAPRRPTTTT